MFIVKQMCRLAVVDQVALFLYSAVIISPTCKTPVLMSATLAPLA